MEGQQLSGVVERRHDFYPDAHERFLRQQGMLGYIDQYLEGMADGTINPGLRPYQELAFPAILRSFQGHLQKPVDVEAPDALDQLTFCQIGDAATSFGKSFLFARVAEAVGVGQPAHEQSPAPIKALLLSYRRVGVSENFKACQRFLPHLRATRCTPAKADPSADIWTMTYAALWQMLHDRAAGLPTPLDGQYFDLIGTDENHHRWGDDFGAAVDEIAHGALEVGLTGTPRITVKNRDVPISFRHSLRTMINNGDAPFVQLLGFATGQDLIAKPRTDNPYDEIEGEFSWKELRPLAINTERNAQIVQILKLFAEEGRMALAGLIPGVRCMHSKLIKRLVNHKDITIIDPVSGDPRNLNFENIDGYMPDRQIERLLERAKEPYSVGGLDGLLSTSLLTESWDNPNVEAMLAACPLPLSQLAQLVGRLMRQGPHEVVILSQLVDRVVGTKLPALITEVVEETDFFNGMIIGPQDKADKYNAMSGWQRGGHSGQKEEGGQAAPKEKVEIKRPLPHNVLLARVVQNTLKEWSDAMDTYVAEFRDNPIINETIRAQGEVLDTPPEGSKSVTELYALPNVQQAGVKMYAFYSLLRNNGFMYSLVRGQGVGGYANYVHEGERAQAFMETHEFADVAEDGRYNLEQLTLKLSTTRMVLRPLIEELKAAGYDMTTQPRRMATNNREVDTYDERQFKVIEAAVIARRKKEPPEREVPLVPISEIEQKTGKHRSIIRSYLKTAFNVTPEIFLSPKSGKRAAYCEKQHADAAERHFSFPEVPRSATLLADVGKPFGQAEETVVEAMAACGHKDAVRQGYRFHQNRSSKGATGGAYTYPYYCESSEALAAVRVYLQEQPTAAAEQKSAASPALNDTPTGEASGEKTQRTKSPRPEPPSAQVVIPADYQRLEFGLAALGAYCEPTQLGWLIREHRDRLTDLRQDAQHNWFAGKNDLRALAEAIQSYPIALPELHMETPAQIAARYKEQEIDITPRDIFNLLRHPIDGKQPIRLHPTLVGHYRTIPARNSPSILKLHFKIPLIRLVDERLRSIIRSGKLRGLHALRHAK